MDFERELARFAERAERIMHPARAELFERVGLPVPAPDPAVVEGYREYFGLLCRIARTLFPPPGDVAAEDVDAVSS